jgi:predicted nucleic acid-binding protein
VKKVAPDTDVYIDWLNSDRHGDVLLAKSFLKRLSAIVLLELEAGAFSKQDQRKDFEAIRALRPFNLMVV